MDNSTSLRALKLRVRSNIMDYFELASSPEEQRDYERQVPSAQVPDEIINQWADCVGEADFDWYSVPEYSADEQAAMRRFHLIWNSVANDTPDVMPHTIDALIGLPVWQRLIDAAEEALRVFEKRGRIEEAASM